VRSRYGATSTIVYEYLTQAGIEIDVQTATALLYGIRSDTNDLGRERTRADVDAFLALYPAVNLRALSLIRRGPLPREYFRVVSSALRDARTYGHAIVCSLGPVDNPDTIAEVADLLLRNEESSWAMVSGCNDGKVRFSLRASQADANAGAVARRMAGRRGGGGGHRMYAAGQVPVSSEAEQSRATQTLEQRFLRAVVGDSPPRARRLVKRDGS